MDQQEEQRKLKISFIVHRPGMSGGARVTSDYARALLAKGHDVRVFAQPLQAPSLGDKLKAALRGRSAKQPRGPSFFDVLGERLTILDGPPKASDLPDADAVIAGFWPTARWVHDLPAEKGKKLYFMQDYGAVGQPIEQVRETWKLGLTVITISGELQGEVQAVSGQPVRVVANGVSPQFLTSEPRSFRRGPPTVGFVISNNEQKGSRYCIEALKRVHEELPDVRGVTFGTRAPREKFDVPPYLEVRTALSDKGVAETYQSADVWLFGSLREGFGLPILEAMASGTPVVAARSAAAPDILPHGGGHLVQPGDPDEMAKRILDILRLPSEAWCRLSEEARHTAGIFSIEKARENFERAILDAVNGRSEQPVASSA